jgi:hypothetical protein
MNIVLTFDIDWAPDVVVDAVADELVRHGVRATWFATHRSAALDRLSAERDLFEVGIHPNFFPGSTHGKTVAEVLQHCMEIVPEARSIRTHGLYQSSRLLNEIMATTPVRRDASLFLPEMEHIRPVDYWWGGESMTRIPTYWADDFELQRGGPRFDAERFRRGAGLKVLAFHPIHIFLNSREPSRYAELKQRIPALERATRADLAPLRQQGPGVMRLFADVIELLVGAPSIRLCDLAPVAGTATA